MPGLLTDSFHVFQGKMFNPVAWSKVSRYLREASSFRSYLRSGNPSRLACPAPEQASSDDCVKQTGTPKEVRLFWSDVGAPHQDGQALLGLPLSLVLPMSKPDLPTAFFSVDLYSQYCASTVFLHLFAENSVCDRWLTPRGKERPAWEVGVSPCAASARSTTKAGRPRLQAEDDVPSWRLLLRNGYDAVMLFPC